ncbi:MGDG synthase family glycosyltransferase [Diplocloster modestus]|uniref:UDP-diphospho-muramoylpentapeptide beta-N-acetylglucosaminyltransferase n=1 Tax=Diplocloster modestus TaxID=2850322 RepID=A0ABS6KAA8_9FIRM|nr:UDP-diphospho-muramoylpentapeptide beta-N-acetylglucosaminyltransferase [Diplocloster modestus]MBU9727436.1 UDP-diphospho-muramoylpentapeptide beta-N-acetylglucosaminyltransferase [Diplocloster modestus]
MKIVILTGKFGMGHYMAASAIAEHWKLAQPNAQIEVIDWFHYVFPHLSLPGYRLFGWIVQHAQKFYNERYCRLENKQTEFKPQIPALMLWRFHHLLWEKQPDLIIATLPLCSQTVCYYREKTGNRVPLITCVTDITAHSEWIHQETDAYMVGSELVKQGLIKKGIPSGRITVTGIPVNPRFDEPREASFDHEHMTDSSFTGTPKKKLLIMGGGLGMLPTVPGFYQYLESQANRLETTIITGRNKSLMLRLSAAYPSLRVLGYVNDIPAYMKEADAIVTKPGGITTFEAIHSETPIFAWNPGLRQEVYNGDFLEVMQIGAVIHENTVEGIRKVCGFLSDDRKMQTLRKNMHALKAYYSQNSILDVAQKALDYASLQDLYQLKKGDYLHEAVGYNL